MKFSQVDNYVWRGSRPQVEADFTYLASRGIKTILNVEGGIIENLSADPNWQQAMCIATDIQHVRLGMSALFAPHPETVNWALMVIQRAVAQPQTYGKVYVHCRQGVDRTGFVVAAYRMRYYDWRYERAVTEMRRLGFHRWYNYWLPALRHWENVR